MITQAKLKEVAAILVRANLKTSETQRLVLHRLVQERDRLKEGGESGLAGCLHSAAVLVRACDEVPDTVAANLQKLVLSLVRVVGASLADPVAPNSAAVAEESEGGGKSLNEMALGEMLVQLGFVTELDVENAMKVRGDRRLGDVLIGLGKVEQEDVERAATLQRVLNGLHDGDGDAEQGTVRLGDLLLRNGVIEREQLDEALAEQEATGVRLGELLVELGHVTWNQIGDAVVEQQKHGGSTVGTGEETVVRLD